MTAGTPCAGPIGDEEFDGLMAPLGPWPGRGAVAPIAVAASGGADSTALALLASGWARGHGLNLLAFVVDHGLRPGSGSEAAATVRRLSALGIVARPLLLDGLAQGPALAERARIARYDLLTRACKAAGVVDLLLGHHAGDQAETVLMRARAGSGPDGLAGMAMLAETADLRLLRPLLPVAPERLRLTLTRHGIGWVEDPSNHDPRAQRARLRQELAEPGPANAHDLLSGATAAAAVRMVRQRSDADALAVEAALHPEGFALLPPALLTEGQMSALVRTIGGAGYGPASDAIARLSRQPAAVTLAGTRLMAAGRLGPGWLLLREQAAIEPDRAAIDGVVWDCRFRLDMAGVEPGGLRIGALGAEQVRFRKASNLPAAVLATLPALRRDDALLAVPHLSWSGDPGLHRVRFSFQPASPATESTLFADR